MTDNFSPQQSLELIREMINKTREDLRENSFYFLLWGWAAFAAILGQFVLKVVFAYPYYYIVWLITIPAIVTTIVYTNRRSKIQAVKTYIGESMSHVWTGIAISFFVLSLIISGTAGGWYIAWPFFILFYGLGTFISGRLLKFTPLVVGGIINWLLAICCLFLPYDYQLLIAAGAILCSYIVPGHLLRASKY